MYVLFTGRGAYSGEGSGGRGGGGGVVITGSSRLITDSQQ